MKNIKKAFQYTLLTIFAAFSLGLSTPLVSTAHAACNDRAFLGFPKWYAGVYKPVESEEPVDGEKPVESKCEVVIDNLNDFWVIVMNFIEIMLVAVAYVSAGFIMWGGFKYIKSEGDPGKISESKNAITNAVIGLVIALASVAIVEYISARIIV